MNDDKTHSPTQEPAAYLPMHNYYAYNLQGYLGAGDWTRLAQHYIQSAKT